MTDGASRARVWAALATVYVVWGSTYLGIDLAVRTIPPFLMAATRFLVAGGLLYAWAIRRGDRARPADRSPLAVRVPDRSADAGGRQRRRRLGRADPRHGHRVADHRLRAAVDGAARPRLLRAAARPNDRARARDRVRRCRLCSSRRAAPEEPEAAPPSCSSSARSPGRSAHSTPATRSSRDRPLVGAAMQMLAGGLMLTIVAAASGELGRIASASSISLESWLGPRLPRRRRLAARLHRLHVAAAGGADLARRHLRVRQSRRRRAARARSCSASR